jgi:hypothetical protein
MKQQTKQQLVKLTTREDKALQLFQAGAVSKISDDLYHVKSQNQKKDASVVEYEIIPSMNVCTRIDFEKNGVACKHVIATQIFRTNQIAAAITAAAKIQTLNKEEAEAEEAVEVICRKLWVSIWVWVWRNETSVIVEGDDDDDMYMHVYTPGSMTLYNDYHYLSTDIAVLYKMVYNNNNANSKRQAVVAEENITIHHHDGKH